MILEEAQAARKKIYRDGYDISVGEIVSLYERAELIIQPEYQRLFRWEQTQKTRFIESLILNIPIPSIFVFSDGKGRWELVDGLQRISTILQLVGKLKNADGDLEERLVCDGTLQLPSLEGTRWPTDAEEMLEDESLPADVLPLSLRLAIRRARIRVEILGQETDAHIKYELFQRLNSGGSNLSEQELRTCIIISINRAMYSHIREMANEAHFLDMARIGEDRKDKQYLLEMVLRFVVLRHMPYQNGLDVHEYLDKGTISIAENNLFDWEKEKFIFSSTMAILHSSVGNVAFLKNSRFSLAMYEFITLGLSKAIESAAAPIDPMWLRQKVNSASDLPEARSYTGIGVRGTQRFAKFIVPLAEKYFQA